MNRDAVLATIIGFAIGLTITGIFLIGPNISSFLPAGLKLPVLSNKSNTTINPDNSPTPLQATTQVVIDSPLHEAVVDSDTILVSGSAPKQSTVVVQGRDEDVASIAGDDGKFAAKLLLVEGENVITVTGYDSEGKQSEQTVSVYYSENDL